MEVSNVYIRIAHNKVETQDVDPIFIDDFPEKNHRRA